VATLIQPDEGALLVFGHDVAREPHAVRSSVGLAGQFAAVEPAMTGRENLEMVARLFGQDRGAARANCTRVLEQMGLGEDCDRLARTYSGGMQRKLDLGASLVGAPRLLLLDEPTTGLDPRSRLDLWDAIRGLVDQGTNVLLTTQYLDEADHLADEIVIIDHGRAIAQGTPVELKQRTGRNVLEVHVRHQGDVGEAATALTGLGTGEPQIDLATRRVRLAIEGGTEELKRAVTLLEQRSVGLDDFALRPPRLDEAFLALTGQVLREQQDGDSAGSDDGQVARAEGDGREEIHHG
jgi:ABC-2 type transport system ATP-binding protein